MLIKILGAADILAVLSLFLAAVLPQAIIIILAITPKEYGTITKQEALSTVKKP